MLRGRMSQQQQQQQQQQQTCTYDGAEQLAAPGGFAQGDRAHSSSIQMYSSSTNVSRYEEGTVAFPPTPVRTTVQSPVAEDASASDDELSSLHIDRLHSWMVDHGSMPPVLHRADGKATESQCIFNMVNALLAIGLLGFPYCFRSCGVLLTAGLMGLSYTINIFSTSVLLVMAQIAGKHSYEELAAYALGISGRLAVIVCLFSLNLGCLVAYVNILADVLSSVAGTIIPPSAEASRDLLLLSVCVFAVLPVSLAVRTSDLMASVSTASLGFLGVFTLVVVIFAFAPIEDANPVKFWDSAGLALSMPVVLYAFTSHTVLFSVYSTMRSPSVSKMKSVVSRSLLICGLAYFAAGVSGYLAFRQRTAGDVLRNLGGSAVIGLRALYERALRLGYGLAALGCVPLVMLPLQHTILPLLVPLVAKTPKYGRWLVAPAGSTPGSSGRSHSGGASSPNASTPAESGPLETTREIPQTSAFLMPSKRGVARVLKRVFCDSLIDHIVLLTLAVPLCLFPSVSPRLYRRHQGHHHSHQPPHGSAGNFNLDGMDISSPLALALTLALTLLALLCALFLPNVELILGLMGSTGAVGVGMILPGAITLRVMAMHSTHSRKHFDPMTNDERKWKTVKLQAWAMLVGGILLATFSTQYLLKAVQEESEVVRLAHQLQAKEALYLEATEVEQKARDMQIAVGSVEQAAETLKNIQDGGGDSKGSRLEDEASVESALGSLKQTEEFLKKGSELGGIGKVDKELEEVEDMVEGVTNQRVDTNTVHESEVALGIVPNKASNEERRSKGETKEEEDPAASKLVVAASKHHKPLRRPTVDELRHRANSASAILETSLQRKGVEEGDSDGGLESLVVDKVSSKLDVAIEALEHATEVQPGHDGKVTAAQHVVDTALNATYDATATLNTTIGAMKESTAAELRKVVDKVQFVMEQLHQLDIASADQKSEKAVQAAKEQEAAEEHGDHDKDDEEDGTDSAQMEKPEEEEGAGVKEGPEESLGAEEEEEEGGTKEGPVTDDNKESVDDQQQESKPETLDEAEVEAGAAKEQLREKWEGAEASWHVNATLDVSDVAEKAYQAAEAARSAALSDIKTAVLKANPRVASRAEEIAAELTLLGAMESMEAQSRKEADKASLGMTVKTVTFGNSSASSQGDAAAVDGGDLLGRRGGAPSVSDLEGPAVLGQLLKTEAEKAEAASEEAGAASDPAAEEAAPASAQDGSKQQQQQGHNGKGAGHHHGGGGHHSPMSKGHKGSSKHGQAEHVIDHSDAEEHKEEHEDGDSSEQQQHEQKHHHPHHVTEEQERENKKRQQEARHREWEDKQDSSAAEKWAREHPVG